MFVVNQNDEMATKIEDICYRSVWSDKAVNEMQEIRRRIGSKVYNYGSTENCENAIERKIKEYKVEHPEELLWVIYINGVNYGVFYSENEARNEYYKVIDALRNKERVYQIGSNDAW